MLSLALKIGVVRELIETIPITFSQAEKKTRSDFDTASTQQHILESWAIVETNS